MTDTGKATFTMAPEGKHIVTAMSGSTTAGNIGPSAVASPTCISAADAGGTVAYSPAVQEAFDWAYVSGIDAELSRKYLHALVVAVRAEKRERCRLAVESVSDPKMAHRPLLQDALAAIGALETP